MTDIVKVSMIFWDTDGDAEVSKTLPKEVELTLDGDNSIEDEIADKLSDTYGFCVHGFLYEVIEE